MNRGRVDQVGTPREVYDQPASIFVAQFIGTPPMNLLPDGQMGPSGQVVGIRPEYLRPVADGPLQATVRQVEHLGHEALLLADTDAGLRLVARTAPSHELPLPGEPVWFDAEERHLHRFDTATGERVR
jgi:ABC-type sugar transport system ATPase subunit